MDNFDEDFEIPVEVYKRFGLPAQYLYGSSSAMIGRTVRNQFATKRSTRRQYTGEKNALSKIQEAVELWADQYK